MHFKHLLMGEQINSMSRRGKFLLFNMQDYVLVSHLRMEGKYRVTHSSEPIDKHTHVIFHFTDGTEHRYNDVRKFGTMHLYPIGKENETKPLNQLGPDPFESAYQLNYVEEKLLKTNRNIKADLLDQTVIAGLGNIYVDEVLCLSKIYPERRAKTLSINTVIVNQTVSAGMGNIYVDEVLFVSKIHPEIRAKTLSKNEIMNIFTNTKEVLSKAVHQGGTTIRSYVDGQGELGMFQQTLFV